MTSDLLIRSATAQDLMDLLGLYAQLPQGTSVMAPADAARILDEFSRYSGSTMLVGYLDQVLVSTCALVVVPNMARGGAPFALIENVLTHATYRRRGFARQLLHNAIDAAWAQGCYKIMLMAGSKDLATLRFYTSAGFEQSNAGFQIRREPDAAT